MVQVRLKIINRLGLHARAAAKLVDLANTFGSDISYSCNGQSADCKSILQIMMLAAAQGAEGMLKAEGEDEQEAVRAIQALVQERFGEDE